MIYSASLVDDPNDVMNGRTIIKTREELDKIVVKIRSYDKVIIRKDFAADNFTPQSLSEYLNNCKKVNPNIIFELDKDTEFYTLDKFIEKMLNVNNAEELIDLALQNEKQFFSCYKSLISTSNDVNMKLVQVGSTISKQKEANDELQTQINDLNYQLSIERRNKVHASTLLDSLVGRINNQYERGVDKNKLFVNTGNKYDRVLYIKEISRVQFVDSLIYYLKEVLRVVYQMPVRVLVIEAYYAMNKVPLYPYLTPHYALREGDVVSGDILMLGVQPKTMRDILKNPSNISMLLILDRAGYEKPHVVDDNVEYFYTVSDLNDKPSEVPEARTISYDPTTLTIPLIRDFDHMDPTAKMGKYSSTPIVKKIIDVLNG